jgi:hypothetical protein
LALMAAGCTDLDEKVFDRIDAGVYYQDESSVKGAVASIYNSAASGFLEYFWYLNEFSADQVAWRTWNGGLWGWDEANKFVLSAQSWNSESLIIKQAWEKAWTTIGLCNTLIEDLEGLDPASLNMTEDEMKSYIGEVRTMRAWAYYNNFELWGGTIPINTSTGGDVPGSADTDFNTGCQKVYDFIATELDEACPYMMKEDGGSSTRNRLNQGMNRMLKMRLLLNSEVFTGTAHYTECAELCREILNGDYGTYSLAGDYRELFELGNETCPEVVFAFAMEDGKLTNNNRNTPFFPYNYNEFCGGTYTQSGWNCTCLAPSHDNTGTVQTTGGTVGSKSFLYDYGDKLGAVYDRFDDRDVRKQAAKYDASAKRWNGGIFIMGAQTNYDTGAAVVADADRDGQALVYVDQVGTFLNQGRTLEPVMSPRWGETNSGYRLMKYPVYPESAGIYFADIDEVEFRLSEVYYTLAECLLRQGSSEAVTYVNAVRSRYFTDKSALNEPGPGFDKYDMDWMLSQWGIEFLNEGRRRRTDLRRFDKFTQGQWWFFGRTTEPGYDISAKRDRKYEWFPLPASAIMVNPGLVQNPNY